MRPWFSGFILLTLAANAPAQAPNPDSRTGLFRAALALYGMKPVENYSTLKEHPERSILILFGDSRKAKASFPQGQLESFVTQGGAVLIASDRRTMLAQADFGVWINGATLSAATNLAKWYRDQLDCPFLLRGASPANRSAPFTWKLDRVATNRPSYLEFRSDDSTRQVFATLPAGSAIRGPHSLNEPLQFSAIPFGVSAGIGHGRYMVLADHSLFINTMILQSDNDNAKFAGSVIAWLGENGKRTDVLFDDDGAIHNYFELNPAYIDPPLPHPDVLMPAVDQMMISLENDQTFNRAINRLVPPWRLLRRTLLALSVLLVAWASYRIIAGKLKFSTHQKRLPQRVEDLADPDATSSRRVRDLAKADLSGPAQELALRCLEELGISADHPSEILAAGLFGKRNWSKRIERIQRIAKKHEKHFWSPDQLTQLGREIDTIRAAAAAGEFRVRASEVS